MEIEVKFTINTGSGAWTSGISRLSIRSFLLPTPKLGVDILAGVLQLSQHVMFAIVSGFSCSVDQALISSRGRRRDSCGGVSVMMLGSKLVVWDASGVAVSAHRVVAKGWSRKAASPNSHLKHCLNLSRTFRIAITVCLIVPGPFAQLADLSEAAKFPFLWRLQIRILVPPLIRPFVCFDSLVIPESSSTLWEKCGGEDVLGLGGVGQKAFEPVLILDVVLISK